jgi:hypothetical protein
VKRRSESRPYICRPLHFSVHQNYLQIKRSSQFYASKESSASGSSGIPVTNLQWEGKSNECSPSNVLDLTVVEKECVFAEVRRWGRW